MKTKFIFFFFIIFGFFNSQIITGKIISSENNQPIPYARIGVENENFGAIADDNGNYKIDLSEIDKTKNIIVQLGGYHLFSQKINAFIGLRSHDIKLIEKVADIAEVNLKPNTYENKNLGVRSKAKKMVYGFSSGSSNESMYREFAIPFHNKNRLKIEKINLNLAILKTDKPIVLNFNVYAFKDKKPGESILSENLTVQLTPEEVRDGTYTFDISDKSIWVDEEEFLVSVQVMSGFKGEFGFSAALFSTVYERSFYNSWEKVTMASPAINIDVKMVKGKRKR